MLKLNRIDLSKTLDKSAYKIRHTELALKLGELQRQARDFQVPVIIAFEGWDAAGKGTLINKLILALDPRGFNVHPTNAPTEEERLRPFLWRFWSKIPARGRIAVFDRSWYGRVLVDRVDKLVPKKTWRQSYDEINAFERQLADDGTVIIKLFLHITKEEQKKRFNKLLDNPATSWKVDREDWRHHRQYKPYAAAVEDMITRTNNPWAHWTLVEAQDERFATVKMMKTAIAAIERKIAEARNAASGKLPASAVVLRPFKVRESMLDKTDLSLTLDRAVYNEQLKNLQQRMHDLEHELYKERLPLVILFEGWDAAGKGGNIRRLVNHLDPRGYEVVPIVAPNDVEKAHHYLWRFWIHFPKAGHIAVFDRSWYGRVMVERVEKFCAESEWKRAYREINEMEEQWINYGTILVKFWLHIDKDAQLARFTDRQNTPGKKWKITDEDWRNREKWNAYKTTVDEMLARTSTVHAPWTIVEATCKLHARIKTLHTVIEAVEKRLSS
jgi:AMP-polyphosphate phosphotransferase